MSHASSTSKLARIKSNSSLLSKLFASPNIITIATTTTTAGLNLDASSSSTSREAWSSTRLNSIRTAAANAAHLAVSSLQNILSSPTTSSAAMEAAAATSASFNSSENNHHHHHHHHHHHQQQQQQQPQNHHHQNSQGSRLKTNPIPGYFSLRLYFSSFKLKSS